MRIVQCDICWEQITNTPVTKVNTKYEYPSARPSNAVFAAVSGTMIGYNSNYWDYNQRQEHDMEICVRCGKYLEHAMHHLRRELERLKKEHGNGETRDIGNKEVGFPEVTVNQ